MEFANVTQAAVYTVGTGAVSAAIGSIGIAVIEAGGLVGMSATTIAVVTLASTSFATLGTMFMVAGCMGYFFTSYEYDVGEYKRIVAGCMFFFVLVSAIFDEGYGVTDLKEWA